jgi:hypothetical protein
MFLLAITRYLELSKKCVEISRTYQNSKLIVKTCKQIDVFIIYIHSISSLEEKVGCNLLINVARTQSDYKTY